MAVQDLDAIDRDALAEQSKGVIEAEKQCRITLAKDAPVAVDLSWHGGRGSRQSVIRLEPGKSAVQPLSKAQAWFGPFAVPAEYLQASDEGHKERLKRFWAQEKARALNKFDYERPLSVSKGGYEPIGPHRFPDVTVTILEADGTELPSIRLHDLYKIGEFDPLKDTFGPKQSADELREQYEAELADRAQNYEREIADMRRQMAEMAGMLKGFMAGKPAKGKAEPPDLVTAGGAQSDG